MSFQHLLSETEQEKIEIKEQPDWVQPMLATLTHDHFDHPDWLYERKLDGQRCLVFKKKDSVSLYSRNKNSLNDRFPELCPPLLASCEMDFIADGEIVAFENGVSSFSRLQPRMQSSRVEQVPVKLYLFDLLHLDGRDLTQLPLRTRKKVLKSVLDFQDPVRFTPHRNEKGTDFLAEACDKGWEGLIAKMADAPYVHSRSRKWLKFKCENRQEFVIGGYTEPEGQRVGFGALLIGFYSNEDLRYAGKVGTGFDNKTLRRLRKAMDNLLVEKSPFSGKDGKIRDTAHWVEPQLVAEVSFTEWTSKNRLRHPSFLGLRDDKNPKKVVKEEPV